MSNVIGKLNEVRHGVMFIIGAPSGTGKTTIIKKLMETDSNLKFSISVTTRAMREGEKDGVDYYFISDEKYKKLIEEDAFYEHVSSDYGACYGTLRSEVDSFLNVGQDVIFDMDCYGLRQMKEKAPNDVVSIYLLPPSIKELRRRLEDRGTDKETIEKRMSMILERINQWDEYDYVVVNVDPEQAAFKVRKIIAGERMKRIRQTGLPDFVQSLIKEVENG